MTTEVQVANKALLKLGGDLITSLSDDTKAARMTNAIFDTLRQEILRGHPWNFATTRDQLVVSVDGPDFEFAYRYDLPDTCLRVLKLYNHQGRFQVEDNDILSDEEEVDILFIQDMEDPSEWDALFLEAFATRLAAEVCYGLTGSPSMANFLMDQYNDKLRVAKQIDAQENYNDGFAADYLTDSRNTTPYTFEFNGTW